MSTSTVSRTVSARLCATSTTNAVCVEKRARAISNRAPTFTPLTPVFPQPLALSLPLPLSLSLSLSVSLRVNLLGAARPASARLRRVDHLRRRRPRHHRPARDALLHGAQPPLHLLQEARGARRDDSAARAERRTQTARAESSARRGRANRAQRESATRANANARALAFASVRGAAAWLAREVRVPVHLFACACSRVVAHVTACARVGVRVCGVLSICRSVRVRECE
eukprot:6174570-Pleurochrysis_carterae.AAC.2